MPAPLKLLTMPLMRRWLTVAADVNPPERLTTMAAYMQRWGLLGEMDAAVAVRELQQPDMTIESVDMTAAPLPYTGQPVRLPAQWEPMQAVILTFPVLYPPLWNAHAQMIEAISAAAEVQILTPSAMWARAVRFFLMGRGKADFGRIRWLHLPTDDIWVRDYGPFVGLDDAGQPVAVSAAFDPLPNYPCERDNAMPEHWAAHHGIPLAALDLHTEGGNLWSDGAGTLIMSRQIYLSNADLSHDEIERRLHCVFHFEKLIIAPRLLFEETGHIDLLLKLAAPDTILVAAPALGINDAPLRAAAQLMRRVTNAAGNPYQVIELPMPPLYLNWGVFPIWRSYTNALTINGRVLVPVFGARTDDTALRIYAATMPHHEIIPIDCAKTINGGGAAHCLTKEIPAALSQ
jgi:agmatine deiminase